LSVEERIIYDTTSTMCDERVTSPDNGPDVRGLGIRPRKGTAALFWRYVEWMCVCVVCVCCVCVFVFVYLCACVCGHTHTLVCKNVNASI
jgi:hypothetical protein